MENSTCSTACSGTRDCWKMTHRSGSSPAASQSVTISRVYSTSRDGSWYLVERACQSAMKKKASVLSCIRTHPSRAPT
jgi:hypothetical protein